MYCKYCGKEQDEGLYCKYCGKKQFEEKVSEEQKEVAADSAGYDSESPAEEMPIAGVKKIKPAVVAGIAGAGAACIAAVVGLVMFFGGDNSVKKDPPAQTTASQTETTATTETTAPADSTADIVSTATSAPEPEPEPEPVIDRTGWEKAYLEKAFELEKANFDHPDYGSMMRLEFCLYDVNGDGFDELYIQHTTGGGAILAAFCTYVNGELIDLGSELKGGGLLEFPKNKPGVYYYSYGFGIESAYYLLEDNKLVPSGEIGEDFRYSYELDKHTSSFEEFVGFLGLDVPKEYEEMKKSKLIPASELMNMTYDEVIERARDLRPVDASDYGGTHYGDRQGYTSDMYFPNTIYYDRGMVEVYDGGLIGDNAYVGMTYNEILVLIDSLVGVYDSGGTGLSIIDGTIMELHFEDPDDVIKIQQKHKNTFGDNGSGKVVDVSDINPVCTKVTGVGGFGGPTAEAKATKRAPLCNAPHDGASILWYLEAGETLRFWGLDLDNEWVQVDEYITSEGVWKTGYIRSEFLKLVQ